VDHYADDVMETACGLHNFRLTHRQKHCYTQAGCLMKAKEDEIGKRKMEQKEKHCANEKQSLLHVLISYYFR
jgi:hypothetical protein